MPGSPSGNLGVGDVDLVSVEEIDLTSKLEPEVPWRGGLSPVKEDKSPWFTSSRGSDDQTHQPPRQALTVRVTLQIMTGLQCKQGACQYQGQHICLLQANTD